VLSLVVGLIYLNIPKDQASIQVFIMLLYLNIPEAIQMSSCVL
jgi:hypothetical protein